MGNEQITKLKSVFDGIRKATDKLGKSQDPLLFAMALKWMASVYLPFIPFTDGGRARGRMVGLLLQFGVRLPDKVIYDKTHVGDSGKLDNKEYVAGLREGRMISPQGAKVEIQSLFNKNKKALKVQKLKDKTELLKELNQMITDLIKNGGR